MTLLDRTYPDTLKPIKLAQLRRLAEVKRKHLEALNNPGQRLVLRSERVLVDDCFDCGASVSEIQRAMGGG